MQINGRRPVLLQSIACVVAALAWCVAPGTAHERQLLQIGGTDYLFVVGFLHEPVYTGDRSGMDLRIVLPDQTNPLDARAPEVKAIEHLNRNLKVEVKAGPHTRMFDVRPTYGAPGRYEALFYLTVATTYSLRLFGTVNNVPVDLPFACNPLGHVAAEDHSTVKISEQVTRKALIGSFGCPSARTDVEFPPASRLHH